MSDLDARIRQLALRFLPEWRLGATVLEEALAAEPPNREAAEDAAHQLAGALGSFGFADAGAAARVVEAALRADDPAAALAALPAFLASFQGVIEDLEPQSGSSEV